MLRRKRSAVLACGAMALSLQTLSPQALAQQNVRPVPSGQPAPGQTMVPRPNAGGNSAIPRSMSSGDTPGGGPRGDRSVADGTLTGRVVLSDDADSEGIAVQRVCGRTVTAVAYTDSSGRFTIPRAAKPSYIGDVSASGNNSAVVSDCELHVSLGGYRADPVPLPHFPA